MICKQCHQPTADNELATYRGRCENCFCGPIPICPEAKRKRHLTFTDHEPKPSFEPVHGGGMV